jgi:DtxR family Mn-dependent transcriptional regulator
MGLLVLAIAVIGLLAWLGVREIAQRSSRERRRIEDALKHLFDHEYRGRRASLSSLAGALRLPDKTVLTLVTRMQALDLVRATGQDFDLTPAGEKLALQVVRAHRLLERYFADEARLPLSQIHAAAERSEHKLSALDVERLSAALGHPSFDPHGDPIPSKGGSVPPPSGTPVTSWPSEVTGRIVHLEDEPQISYAQIVAEGLRVGQLVRVIESTPARVILTDGENEFRLAPAVAANVFLASTPDVALTPDVSRLSEWPNGSPATVVGLDEACQGFSRRRMMDLGFTEGATIRPVLSTFAGDPRAYEVRGTLVAIRRDQAAQILVRPIAPAREGAA